MGHINVSQGADLGGDWEPEWEGGLDRLDVGDAPRAQESLPYMKETERCPLWMLNNTACLEKGVGDGSRVGIGGSLPRESTYDCWLTVASSHLLPHNCRAIIILRLRMS